MDNSIGSKNRSRIPALDRWNYPSRMTSDSTYQFGGVHGNETYELLAKMRQDYVRRMADAMFQKEKQVQMMEMKDFNQQMSPSLQNSERHRDMISAFKLAFSRQINPARNAPKQILLNNA